MSFIPGANRLPSCDAPLERTLEYNGTIITTTWSAIVIKHASKDPNIQDAAKALLENVLKFKNHLDNDYITYCCIEVNKANLNISLRNVSPYSYPYSEDTKKIFKSLKIEYDKLKELVAFL